MAGGLDLHQCSAVGFPGPIENIRSRLANLRHIPAPIDGHLESALVILLVR